MPYPIPLDTIHQLQISLRKEAKIPSYDPTDPQLPKFPSLEQSISQLEPSPSYMRCKHCKGRLIRGIKSLFCVFCGKDQFGEIPPDPINFRSTTGHSWLLESLQLDGSEVVELISEATDVNRGRSAPKNEMPLADLLNLEILWHTKVEPENVSTEATSQAKFSLNLGGVNLDNFFGEGKGEVTSLVSKELFPTDNADENISFQGQEDLSFFQSAPASTASVNENENGNDSSQSSWAAAFQFASSEAANKESTSVDLFPSSQADISMHVDTVFGPGANSGATIPSSNSNADDLFQDNPRSTSSFVGPANSSSVNDDDWFHENQWKSGRNNLNQGIIAEKNDDSLDAWDDFMGSTGQKNHATASLKEETVGVNLFSPVDDAQKIDFGAFQQPDLFPEAFNSQNNPKNVDELHPVASTLERGFHASMDEKDGNKPEAAKVEDKTKNDVSCSSTEVEMIMSQMHDLSFIIDSNLSIPQRSTFSEDRL